jgi:hypothetical protein
MKNINKYYQLNYFRIIILKSNIIWYHLTGQSLKFGEKNKTNIIYQINYL